MIRRRRVLRAVLLSSIAAAIAALVIARSGLPPLSPNFPGTFDFAALGDAPYYPWEDWRYPLVLRDIDRTDVAFSIHVGDIFRRPCSDARYTRSLQWFNGLNAPLIYVPGDNEWADCWGRQQGGFNPRERLAHLRQTLYPQPGVSLGRSKLPLETQSANPAFGEFVEHQRWSYRGLIFATLHVVGSGNFADPFPGRTDADDHESRRRLDAALAWLHETFTQATSSGATGVVLAFHADPGFDWPYVVELPFTPLLDALVEHAVRFGQPVLLIHGDTHDFVSDHPLKDRATGEVVSNVTRLEVPGSPRVGWARVFVTPGALPSFAFDQRVIPIWKYW